jgi:NDP-sugar pyrophosphorylase family protein
VIEEGAVIGPASVIGAGARVVAGAVVERSVVWSGVVATGEVRETVVTTSAAADRESGKA